MRFFKNIITFY